MNLVLLILMFGCQRANLLVAEKAIGRDYSQRSRRVTLWEDGFEVNVNNLYTLVKEIADLIDVSDLEQEIEALRSKVTVIGHNFFHLLFSLPVNPKDEHFEGFMDIFKKCFPDNKILKEIAEKHTEIMRMNILHLAVLSGSTYIGKLILNSVEDITILDEDDIDGESPLSVVVDKYVAASVERNAREGKENYLELLELMLKKGFGLVHKSKVKDKFLTSRLNRFYDFPYDGKADSRSNKRAMAALVKLLFCFKKASKGNERVRRELEMIYSTYKENLAEQIDQRLLGKIDKAIGIL